LYIIFKDPSEILLEQQHFYKTLYSSRNINDYDESFFNHDIKLTEDQKDLCEGNLTFKECAESLKFMINGKHPGSDGYTVDFYKFFWKDIGPFVFRSLFYGKACVLTHKSVFHEALLCITYDER
jgi:hypothetical protein